jgi:rhodanese-related sulfurtransferase
MSLPEFKQLCDEAKKQIEEITVEELIRRQKADDDFALIDVREREESATGMIQGAVAMPRGILELHIDQVTTDKDKAIVLYCGGGSRSALAALNLQKMGFRQVLSLTGGYREWMRNQL